MEWGREKGWLMGLVGRMSEDRRMGKRNRNGKW